MSLRIRNKRQILIKACSHKKEHQFTPKKLQMSTNFVWLYLETGLQQQLPTSAKLHYDDTV